MRPVVVTQSVVAGGAEGYLRRLYKGLAERGHEPWLVGSLPGWPDELPQTPVPLGPKWGKRTIVRGLTRLPKQRRAIAATVDGLSPDLFHLQFKREQIGFTAALAQKAPVVWTEHGRLPSGPLGAVLAAGYRRAARSVTVIICVSDIVAAGVKRVVDPDTHIEVIPLAVDTNYFTPPTPERRRAARAMFDLPEKARVAAWVGQLHKGKMPELAIEVARRFDGTLLMAGDGPERSAIHGKAPANVRLLGQLADPRVVYDAADVFLFTSTGVGEGLPTTLLEAAAHGLPLVANERSGFGPMVRDAGGAVSPDDPARIAVELYRAGTRTGMSNVARTWAEEHDEDLWLIRHEMLFTWITQGRQPAKRPLR